LYKPNPQLSKRIVYNGCTSARQSLVSAGATAAQSYAANALSYLNSGATGARYTTWFGAYTSTRYNLVKSHFTYLSGHSYQSYTYDCTCTESAYGLFGFSSSWCIR
jgi:peptidyl-Lys metalloendopeptidase